MMRRALRPLPSYFPTVRQSDLPVMPCLPAEAVSIVRASKCHRPGGGLNTSLGVQAQNAGMAHAIALARTHFAPFPVANIARAVIVSGCGLALALAGPILPF